MSKQTFHFKCYMASLFILCLLIFSACENPADDTTQPDTPRTQVEFTNLEKYSATIYSDPARETVFAEVAANGTTKVDATPAPAGTAFYPTFHLDIFDMPGISVPYNAEHIIAMIEDKKTAKVPIPKLDAIEINSAYIKIKNDSDFSLALRQGNTEILTLDSRNIIVMPGQNALYEVTPGSVSSYTFMRNTTTAVEFPAGLSEFKSGIIYSFTYTNTGLVLTSQTSVLQSIPPAMPLNVQAEVLSSDSVRITWNEVSGATSYRVYRATSAEGAYSSVGTSASASYTDTSVSAGQAYYYKITALSGGNRESARSTAAIAIMPPADVRVTATNANSVNLAWNAFSGASGYNIYRSDSEDGIYSKVNTAAVTEAEFIDTGLLQDAIYWYKVSAVVDGAEGLLSGQIPASASSVPGNVRVTAKTANSVSLAWYAISGADGYNVYRSDSENGIYSRINTGAVTGTVFTDTDLLQDATYWYKVSSIVDDAESLLSAQIPASTSSVPGNVRITSANTIRVVLAWNVVPEAGGYNVYRSNSENGTYNRINTDAVTGTEFTDTNVSSYATYFYKVSAIISGIEGIQSSPVSASTADVTVPGSGLTAKLNWLQTNALSNSDYLIEVAAAESIGPATLSYSNRTNIGITLRGTGAARTVSLSSNGVMFTVAGGVTLVLDNNITLQGRSGNNNSLVRVNAGGTLVMNTGSRITGNNNTNTASSSSSSSFGGGVYVNSNGTFTMSGGTVSGNTSYRGGGVYVDGGTFTMSSGTVSGNSGNSVNTASSSYGGGVFVSGTFTMSGGTVSGNTSYAGGGVYVSGGTFTMNGGTVSGNTASGYSSGGTSYGAYGGGVAISANGVTSFSKTGGTIYGYSAGDTSNSNVVKNSSGTVQSNGGHAVYASYSPSRRRDTTAGTGVNMSCYPNGNGGYTFSGGWDN